MRLDRWKRGFSRFNEMTPLGSKIAAVFLILFCLLIFSSILYGLASDWYESYKANHLSNADNLRTAQTLCLKAGPTAFACSDPDNAMSHLEKIPSDAPEYSEASQMLSDLRTWKQALQLAVEKSQAQRKAEHDRLASQSQEESRQQMLRNISGDAHDSLTCGISTDNKPIISFDYGHYWWWDDGRCAAQQEKERDSRERLEQLKREDEQKSRDSDAELSSYWSTTFRVDTDMDSFWLNNEERTCQTYPDAKGRIAVVACNTSGSHRDHNIPVTFWGGVDRNTVSDWKCRRESDNFVCRAIN